MAALEKFIDAFFTTFDETFNQVQGVYLDRGTSLFETLASISAEEASRPVGASCASIAAQVEHVRFYIDRLEGHMLEREMGKADWDEIWRTVGEVSTEEWGAIQARLRASYERVLANMKRFDTWDGEEEIGAALAILVHTAYHLGEIRQALCTVRRG